MSDVDPVLTPGFIAQGERGVAGPTGATGPAGESGSGAFPASSYKFVVDTSNTDTSSDPGAGKVIWDQTPPNVGNSATQMALSSTTADGDDVLSLLVSYASLASIGGADVRAVLVDLAVENDPQYWQVTAGSSGGTYVTFAVTKIGGLGGLMRGYADMTEVNLRFEVIGHPPYTAPIDDATGGAIVDAEARTAVNAILAVLRTDGIIAT